MKYKYVIITFFLSCFLVNISFAKDDNPVSLTATGSGKNFEDAKLNALRSAVSQAYGAFISSETVIINDELKKEEIVSISTGNIQEYELLSQIQMPNGDISVTLSVIVSLSKLATFAQSKGVSVSFKGEAFGEEYKLKKFNEESEKKSISALCSICKVLLASSLDYSLSVKEPIKVNNGYLVELNILATSNDNLKQFYDYFTKTLSSISLTSTEKSLYTKRGEQYYSMIGFDFRSIESYKAILDFLVQSNYYIFNFKIKAGSLIIQPEKSNIEYLSTNYYGENQKIKKEGKYDESASNKFRTFFDYSYPPCAFYNNQGYLMSDKELYKYYLTRSSDDKASPSDGTVYLVWELFKGHTAMGKVILKEKTKIKFNLSYYLVALPDEISGIDKFEISKR